MVEDWKTLMPNEILLHSAPCLFWLALAFLTLNVFLAFISFAMACLLGLAVCFCLPCIIAFMCIYASQVHQKLTPASFPNTDLKFQVMRSNLMLEQRADEISKTQLFAFGGLQDYLRAEIFKETVTHNAYSQDPYAKEFGIKISQKLASVEARILPPPWLKYHDTGREKDFLKKRLLA